MIARLTSGTGEARCGGRSITVRPHLARETVRGGGPVYSLPVGSRRAWRGVRGACTAYKACRADGAVRICDTRRESPGGADGASLRSNRRELSRAASISKHGFRRCILTGAREASKTWVARRSRVVAVVPRAARSALRLALAGEPTGLTGNGKVRAFRTATPFGAPEMASRRK